MLILLYVHFKKSLRVNFVGYNSEVVKLVEK